MSIHLGMACACGRSVSAPCPSVADIPAVQSGFAGWGYDEHGFVRCAECLAGGTTKRAAASDTARQGELFAGEAA